MPAHSIVVEGVQLPAPLGGHPALDFCNTWAGWQGAPTKEYLESYKALAVWSGYAGLLPPARIASARRDATRSADAAAALLDDARAFRARLYGLLKGGLAARRERGALTSFDLVAEDVHAAAAALRLRWNAQAIEWEIDPNAGLAAPILAVAWSAGQLLTSPEWLLVRACPGSGCGWLFLDRRGRRRWCTMATCGNRAKVRRFEARRRETAM
jgi:predicted RNA-binding Zn ribbon-like protein